jgi:hypothetical protein
VFLYVLYGVFFELRIVETHGRASLLAPQKSFLFRVSCSGFPVRSAPPLALQEFVIGQLVNWSIGSLIIDNWSLKNLCSSVKSVVPLNLNLSLNLNLNLSLSLPLFSQHLPG